MGNLERYLQELEQSLTEKEAKVGWFPTATYPDGTKVAFVAMQNELGDPAKGIPPRPFLRPTITTEHQKWGKNLGSMIKQGMTGAESLDGTALSMRGDIHKAIVDVTTPELAKQTLEARKSRGNSSESPLNDTGHMLDTLIGIVEDK